MKQLPSLKITLLISLVALATLVFSACTGLPANLGNPASPTNTPPPASNNPALVIAEGKITPRVSTQVHFLLGGKVSEILVKAGDKVSKDNILARIGDTAGLQANLSTANFELYTARQAITDLNQTAAWVTQQKAAAVGQAWQKLINARQALSDLDTKEFQTEIDDARQAVIDTQKTRDDRQEDFDKVKDFARDNPSYKSAEDALKDAQKAYDDAVFRRDNLLNRLSLAKTAVDLSQAEYDEAQRQAAATQDGPDRAVLAQLQQREQNAQAQVAGAQAALDQATLRAPFGGTIMKVFIEAGESVAPGQAVFMLADIADWYVDTTDLTEKEVVKIEVGQDVRVIPDALPELELRGIVESIEPLPGVRAGDVVYTVRVKLTDNEDRLLWGMTVEARFEP